MQISSTVLNMGREVEQLREEYQEKHLASKDAASRLKDAEQNLFNQMTIEGCKSFRLEGVGLISQSARPYARITDIAKASDYLKGLGIYEEVMQVKPVVKRLNELMRESYIEKEMPIPESEIGISVNITPTISIRKS